MARSHRMGRAVPSATALVVSRANRDCARCGLNEGPVAEVSGSNAGVGRAARVTVDQSGSSGCDAPHARNHLLVCRPRGIERTGRQSDLGVRIDAEQIFGQAADPEPRNYSAMLDRLTAYPRVVRWSLPWLMQGTLEVRTHGLSASGL